MVTMGERVDPVVLGIVYKPNCLVYEALCDETLGVTSMAGIGTLSPHMRTVGVLLLTRPRLEAPNRLIFSNCLARGGDIPTRPPLTPGVTTTTGFDA
jgi:hypothetical protein